MDRNARAKQVDRDCRVLEKEWTPKLQAFFVRLGVDIARRMQSRSRRVAKILREERAVPTDDALRAQDILDEVWNDQWFDTAFAEIVTAMLDETTGVALETLALTMGLSYETLIAGASKAVQKEITSRANKLVGFVRESAYKQVKRNLKKGILEGEAIPDLAKRVQEALKIASKHRATVIARTEVISAYNGAVFHGGGSLPDDIAAGLEWISASDSRTRPTHRDADGQVVRIGEKFRVGGEDLRYPGDPQASAGNIIQCRCTTAILTPEEMRVARVEARNAERLVTAVALGKLGHRDALHELLEALTPAPTPITAGGV